MYQVSSVNLTTTPPTPWRARARYSSTLISPLWLLTSIKVFGCTLSVVEGTSVEFVNLAGVTVALFEASEAVELVETVVFSELATVVVAEVDATASELCEAGDVDATGVLAFTTSLVATGAETVELGVAGKAASPPKISAAVTD